ncbi:hypothetical protein CsSME_00019480 [Camellia sinensis var. sinensis]
MADLAVKMVKAGYQYITVLGVDFMSENVRAILDQAGFLEIEGKAPFILHVEKEKNSVMLLILIEEPS